MAKKMGIDLGSASIGWFIRENEKIINNGVLRFKAGMLKGQSGYSSPTKDRREARSKRNLIRARKYRKWELLKILINNDYVPLTKEELDIWSKYKKGREKVFPENENFQKWLACDFRYQDGINYNNPYELRVKAITKRISKHELGRVLYHLVQRRGYKDIGEKDKETENQIKKREESGFKAAMDKHKTIAEALKTDFLDKGKRARNQYPYRNEYEDELIQIMDFQGFDTNKNKENEYSNTFVRDVRKAIIWQRPLRSQKGNIGKCILETTKPRCPVSHPIFEIFRAWQYINTIKTVEQIEENRIISEPIPIKFKEKLFEDVFLNQDRNFKFQKIKNFLDKLYSEKKEYNYRNRSTKKYDSTVAGMPVCKGLIKIFGAKVKDEIKRLHTYTIGTDGYELVGNYSLYDIWHLIFSTDNNHIQEFAENKLNIKTEFKVNKKGEQYEENPIVKLKANAFSTSYCNLSLKAMRKIIPFLKIGFKYDDAVLLAKMPENIENWSEKKDIIYKLIKAGKNEYQHNKDIVYITNTLINKYKGIRDNTFAYKDYDYRIDDYDKKQVLETCVSYFGDKTWKQKENKEQVIKNVQNEYQNFFRDTNRDYREVPTLTSIIKKLFENEGIQIEGELYHHSQRDSFYPEPIINQKHGKEILAVPFINSIKNPMFNKAMSLLRKLINELIIKDDIDNETEIIVEVARELNDNNKRIAIERYQNERKREREKIRQFINEFKNNNAGFSSLNTEENISVFELWEEQTFTETTNENGKKIKNYNPIDIRKEKNAIERYKLWMEQRGQCIYTGKMISITQLFSSEIEIEHTIPRSKLPDNTKANKTVCFSKYNSDIKGNNIPKDCSNYKNDREFPEIGICTAIEPRIQKWEKLREFFENKYKDRQKPNGNEDEEKKNKRIQEKHYYKMYFDYWKDKVARFTADEIKETWVRRQLTDTQMVSKYAREFLKTYFNKVLVQKGYTTSDFRKIYGFHGEEKKDRSKHTHHSIDAAVLTIIPTNSSRRIEILKNYYSEKEIGQKTTQRAPDDYKNFNAQFIVDTIEKNTLIVNYEKDKITQQTYRNVRKRGKLQYLKNKTGDYITDKAGKRILLKSRGATIRGDLFQDTYIGKIRNVERDANGTPQKNPDGTWKFLTGKDEFTYTKRVKVEEAKIEDIIDPVIKDLIKKQLQKGVDIRNVKDHQGNTIRHIRVKTGKGRIVKERVNYKSKHDYKNSFYSASGEVPYAIFITDMKNGNVERKMIPIPIHEVAQTYKAHHKFTPELYLRTFHPEIGEQEDIKLLKVGQKVFVLKEDIEYEERRNIDFQKKRLYIIDKLSEGSVWLSHHLEARNKSDIDQTNKEQKDKIVRKIEIKYNLPEIEDDKSIEDTKKRRSKYEKDRYSFSNYTDIRMERLISAIGKEKVKNLRADLRKMATVGSEVDKNI